MPQPAARQDDIVFGTDTHILMLPSPGGPIPTPLPLPFNGALSSGLSTDVFVNGRAAATVDSVAVNRPAHIPTGGPFQSPPSNEGRVMVGSPSVLVNSKPMARVGDTVLTCNDPPPSPPSTITTGSADVVVA